MKTVFANRIVSVLLCVLLFALSAAPVCAVPGEDVSVAPEGPVFEERLLYGGTALDIGGSVCYASPDGLRIRPADSPESESTLLLPLDVSYLNHSRGRLWFISGRSIYSCDLSGGDLRLFREFDSPVSHLYVSDDIIYILRGETVLAITHKGEREVFTREGIAGFIPENGGFRWISARAGYHVPDNSGDEVYSNDVSPYVEHFADSTGAEAPLPAREDASGEDVGSGAQTDSGYTGPYVNVGAVTLPLAQHMPGTFFSKNGKACVCHYYSPSTYCIDSVGDCNCMRYYPTGYKETCEVDLLGAQCFAFARMVFYTCFGFIDHSMNSTLYYNVGTLQRGSVTANTVKELLMKAAPGAHVRLAAGHSVSILTMDDDFIVIYHGNAGGDGVKSAPCVVSTRRYTWEQFASAAALGIQYVNMPYNYPDSSLVLTEKAKGYYRLNENLNLRAEPNTISAVQAIIPRGTIVNVTETNAFWGKTEYGAHSGWVFLEYTTYYTAQKIEPSANGLYSVSGDFVVGRVHKQTLDSFAESFDKQNLSVTSPSGAALSGGDYVSTGCVLSIAVGTDIIDSKTLVLAGDVNGNGYIDVGDYAAVRRAVLGTFGLSGASLAAADVSGDGTIGSEDYARIRRFFLGTIEEI